MGQAPFPGDRDSQRTTGNSLTQNHSHQPGHPTTLAGLVLKLL